MRLFWRAWLYSGLAALAVGLGLLGYAEVVGNQLREEEARYEAEEKALEAAGAPIEYQKEVQEAHEAVMRPKRLYLGRLEIAGYVALMAGLILGVFGALAPGAKRTKPRTTDPLAGADEGW